MHFKNKFQIFPQKYLPVAGVLLLLAAFLLRFGNSNRKQASGAIAANVYFDGEYRIADGEGNRCVVKTVLNQHNEASDMNDNCGYQSDYIYLLITRDRQDEKAALASMMGNGSVIIIAAFALLSAGAIAWICITQKKRRIAATVGAESVAEGAQKNTATNDESV